MMVSESSGTRRGVAIASARGTADDAWRLQGHHHAELSLGNQADGRSAEPQREQPIERRGAAAALQMSQHERSRLFPRHLLDRVRHLVGDAAEPLVRRIDERHSAAFGDRTFRGHHDAEMPALASRRRILSQTLSMSNGISGIRITSADPARPAWSAINPAFRPMTSTTITRS